MKRLLFLIPDLNETRDVARELDEAGLSDSHVHVYSSQPNKLVKAHIHPANVFHLAHFAVVMGRGVLIGVAISVLIWGLFLIALPSHVHISVLGYLGILGFGFGFGFWISGLIGLEVFNHFMEKYQNDVREGYFLMMVDTPDERADELTELVRSHHPNLTPKPLPH